MTNVWDEKCLEDFNEAQRNAVEYCDGPSLVVAGAGSGKTRVLTYKIAYLIARHGLVPWSILALTFTNKAAREMRERIGKLLGEDDARHLWMGTFHSIFLRILRTEYEAIGFSANFTIYDAADSKSLVKSIIKEMELDDKIYKPGNILARISNAKNKLVGPQAYYNNSENLMADTRSKIPAMRDIYVRYWNRCRQSDAMDFDDILVYTFLLFDRHPDIRQKYQDRFQYVLVDEYQDTNYAQHRIVWQLTEQRQKVCVVGDDAQSIYSFRGANIDNILKFRDLYADSKLFKLERNYRSTQTIVQAANSLIHKNNNQIFKNVYSELEVGEKIDVYEAHSDVEEGQIVGRKIQEIKRREHLQYSDFAILYRTNAQSRVFEEYLRKNGLPYRIYGGLSFYQRKEVKDVIAYFRLAVNPNDEEAFKRVINYPTRGIGNTTVSKITSAANIQNVSLWKVISDPVSYGVKINRGTEQKIADFRHLIEQFVVSAQQMSANEICDKIVKESGIINDIYADRSPENISRQENIEELMNGVVDYCDSRREEGNDAIYLQDYLSEVALLSDVDSDDSDEEEKITLMTIHSAKGLEFNTVFVVGLEETLFPSQMACDSPHELEEERRLFYVAITRAERHCFITYAKSRFRYGKMEFGNPSRFIRDIDDAYLNLCGTARKQSSMFGDVQLPWKKKSRIFDDDEPEFMKRTGYDERREYTSHEQDIRHFSGRSGSSFSSAPKKEEVSSHPSVKMPPPPSNIRRLVKVPSGNNSSVSSSGAVDSLAGISVGKHIEHDRFGVGVVEKIEGVGGSAKATVTFQHAGTKQLLLKFARFKVID